MDRFRTGNVVRAKNGSMMIVVGYRTTKLSGGKELPRVVDWISFDSSNCSGSTRVDAYEESQDCMECFAHGYSEGCEECNGDNCIVVKHPGTTEWTVVGDNVQSYIKKCLLKNFGF